VTLRRKSTYAFAQKHAGDNPGIARALALPMLRPILDKIDENRAAKFFILTIPQLMKSLSGQLYFMRSRLVDPQPTLWYRESRDQLDAFAADKFNPLFDAIPPLKPLLFKDRYKRKTLSAAYVDGSTHSLLSAGTKGNRQSRTACDIFFDEPWLYDPGAVDEIQKRRGAFPHDYREIYMSTGPTVDSEADQIWMSSDRATWFVRCPACEKLFFPARTHHDEKTAERIGGLVYDTVMLPTGMPDEAAIAASTQYKCPICRVILPNTDATRLAMSGTADNPIGEYVVTNESAAPLTFGFNVNWIAVKDWAELAIKMVKAQIAKSRAGDLTLLEEVIRKYDAARWDPELYHRPEKFARFQHPTPYLMREAWAGELKDPRGRPMRFAKVDVQLDYFVLVIRKWGKFSQSRLHFCAKCLSPSEIAQHLAANEVPPERVFFDTRHDTQRIRTICARMGWRTLMGDKAMRDYAHDDGIRRIYDQPKTIDAFTGTVLQGQPSGGYVVECIFSKNSALNRLHLLRSPDSLAPDGTPLHTAASDAPDWYFKENNAHWQKRVENPDGSHSSVWMGQKEDHGGDCEAMGVVVASMAELTGAESLGPDAGKAAG
jgi:hypothetical protein